MELIGSYIILLWRSIIIKVAETIVELTATPACLLVLQQVWIVASFAINTKATSVVYTINVFISKFGL